jgi:hypothetical protein
LPLTIAAAAALIIFVLTVTVRAQRRRDAAAEEATNGTAEAPKATPPGLSSQNDAPSKLARGSCRYCQRRAEYRTPVIRHARPWGDTLLRRFGIVPQVRFQLEIPQSLDADVELCDLHHHRAVSLLGAEIAATTADQAKFMDATTRRLIAFQAIDLHGKMESDAQADSKRKRKPAASPVAAVVSIASAKDNVS